MTKKLMLTLMSVLLTLSLTVPQGFVTTVHAQQVSGTSDAGPQIGEQQRESSQPDASSAYGYINVKIDRDQLLHDNRKADGLDSLESSYSLLDQGLVTKVKNQNPYGTCWTFATMGSAESGILKKYGETKDLAELQIAYFCYKCYQKADPLGLITNDGNTVSGSNIFNTGGNSWFSTFALASGIGFSEEADYPYTSASSYSSSSATACYHTAYRLRSALWLEMSEPEVVKQALKDYGALAVSYYHDDSYFNSSTNAYYQKKYDYANHAVTLVGWDDNYSRTNFKSSTRPSSNGAWLIKNSWGTNWGNSGYFWISYEDLSIKASEAVFFDVEMDDSYATEECNLYQYDGSGFPGWESYDSKTMYEANIYAASSNNETLTDIGFVAGQADTDYTLYVYRVSSDSNPTSGSKVLEQSGHVDSAGYYLIPVENPVVFAKGEKFSVVVKMSSSNTIDLWVDYTYTFEYDDGSKIKMYNDVTNDISFYSTNGSSWSSLTSDGESARIKALTRGEPTYLVKFVNEDGTVLQSERYAMGEMPEYTGATPTKAADEGYSYKFAGWTPEITAVDGPAVYTATYSAIPQKYLVRFVNYDGKILYSKYCEYGTLPAYYGDTPRRPADDQYTYAFAGWTPEIVTVTRKATYTATYTAVENGDEPVITSLVNGDTDAGISVSFSAVKGAECYEVQVSRDGGEWTSVVSDLTDNTIMDENAIVMGSEYSYRVRVCVDGQWSEFCDAESLVRNPFTDVSEGTDDFTHVAWAFNHGIVGGTSKTTYSLDASCTRAQFCIMVYKMNGLPEVEYDAADLPFSDIGSQTSNTKKAIIWCNQNGIVNGKNGKFSPKGNIQRSQLVIILYKMAGLPDVSNLSCPFTDISEETSHTKNAIIWAYNNGLDDGYCENGEYLFKPRTNGTRAQLTRMLYGYEQLYHIVGE